MTKDPAEDEGMQSQSDAAGPVEPKKSEDQGNISGSKDKSRAGRKEELSEAKEVEGDVAGIPYIRGGTRSMTDQGGQGSRMELQG